ncbi:MAG: prepilin-type N-terminal cleavage/methylation domain-containing protein [Verrucomicrobia bacterium]|nr:prepilin-type N-terminal cleavage/methylation domain-containing protein [Verrucomicrobiota bacterium]
MNVKEIRPGRRSYAGFTLIEVMVATFVFAIVLASLFGTWRVIAQSTEKALRVASEAQRTRLALQALESALGSAQLFQANAKLYSFVADTSGDLQALSFVATLPDSFPGSGFFAGQRLRRLDVRPLPSEEGGIDLVLFQRSVLAPEDVDLDGHPLVLARNISLFQLEFWDRQRNEFAPEWLRTNALPPAVRLTLGFGGSSRAARRPAELVTRIVRLPDNVVGADLQGGAAGPSGGNVR